MRPAASPVDDSVEMAQLVPGRGPPLDATDATIPSPPPETPAGPEAASRSSDSGSEADTDEDQSPGGPSRRQEQWPPSFCCPITQEPMHDPVVAMDGHSYESAVISEWLREHQTSPVTTMAMAIGIKPM